MKTIRALKIVAMLPLAFMVAILLLFGIGEAVGGDLSGLMHLVEVAIMGVVVWVAWKRPFWGGILLLVGAALQTFNFWRAFQNADASAVIAPLVIILLPLAFSGLLLLLEHWLEHHPRPAPVQK